MPQPRRVLWLGAVAASPAASLTARVRDHLALRGWFVHEPHPDLPPPDPAAFALVHCWGLAGVAAWLPTLLAMRDAGRVAVLTPLTLGITTGDALPDGPDASPAGVRGATLRLGRVRQAFALTQVAHLLPATPAELAVLHRVFPAGEHLPVTFLPAADDPDTVVGAAAATVAAVYDEVMAPRTPTTPGRASDGYIAALEDELGREYAARATPDRETEALEAEVAWYRDLVEGGEVWRAWRHAEGEAADRLAHIIRLNAALAAVRDEISRDYAATVHTGEQRDLLVAALLEARAERDGAVARGKAQVVAVERERDAVEAERVHATRALIALEGANAALRDARAALEAEVRWRGEAMDALVAERDWLRSRIPPPPPTLRQRVGRVGQRVRVVRPRQPANGGTNGTNGTNPAIPDAAGSRECAS